MNAEGRKLLEFIQQINYSFLVIGKKICHWTFYATGTLKAHPVQDVFFVFISKIDLFLEKSTYNLNYFLETVHITNLPVFNLGLKIFKHIFIFEKKS